MRTYVLYFALIVLLANAGHALAQLATGKDQFISVPLLAGSVCAAGFALFVVRKRLRQAAAPKSPRKE